MATFNAKVTGGGLNLRSFCSTSASSPIQIPNNTAITVSTVSDHNDWFQTAYDGHNGYVVAQYVAITNDGGVCTVTTQSGSLNIRKTPSTSAAVIYTAPKNATLRLLDYTSVSGWYRVSCANGTGWASASYITISTYPNGGDSSDAYTIMATVDTDKHGVGGTLNLRASASQDANTVTKIPDGATIYVQSLSGEWLAAKYNTYIGYVMAKFVVGTNAYNGSTGGGSIGSTLQKGSTGPEVLTLQNRRISAITVALLMAPLVSKPILQ